MTDGIDGVRDLVAAAKDVAPIPGNVTPLRGNPESLKPRARGLLTAAIWAGDMHPALDRDYLVKGWLDRGAVSVIYGASNVGKSFLALDIAHHVAKGLEWGGWRGAGFYISRQKVAALSSIALQRWTHPNSLF
jgi:hypothetical protein